MKKKMIRFTAVLCALACMLVTLPACDGRQKIDATKTQLYVGNYEGGMGSRWLDEYKKGFEEKYKDYVNDDKVGVEVIIMNDKITYAASNLENSIEKSSVNVFFTELLDYYAFAEKGLLYDISDAVTGQLDGESKSIADKLSADQKSYYTSYDGKYYGLPHYRTLRGITYDIDLFNAKKLYIKADGTIAGKSTDTDLSNGPDGKKGTYDDGLPATYEEFFKWCDYVYLNKGIIPICWTGTYKEGYTRFLTEGLFVDAQGVAASSALFNGIGENETVNVSTLTVSGTNVSEQNIDITRDNYKEITKSSGLYYGLDFFYKIIKGNYYYDLSLNSTQTHELTHADYLYSRFESGKKPIAMMIEGTWWEEEAEEIFEEMSEDYDGASRTERNFGFMPLPKADSSKLGDPVLYDGNQSIVMVNGNCDNVHADLAKKFIQYISSDENLQLFNTITGIARDYDFSLTTEQYNGLSTFAKSVNDIVKNSKGVVYGYPTTYATYKWKNVNPLYTTRANTSKGEYSSFLTAFQDGITAEEFFNGIYDYNKNNKI